MEIRPSRPDDIPSIVELLRLSLGETLLPKSVEYWNWKHVANPFGVSPVLLAFEGGQLIGVRAFMHWRWMQHGKHISAVRAVDTATHPDFQGKGVFKKLTLGLVEQCERDGIDFIFNTPNNQSRPGYIKMGWQVAGRFLVRPKVNFDSAIRWTINRTHQPVPDDSVNQVVSHAGLDSLLQQCIERDISFLITPHSVESLSWRYVQVPGINYYSCKIATNNHPEAVAFYRFKQTKLGLEMRVTDFFCESSKYEIQLQELLLAEADKHNASFITLSGLSSGSLFKGLLSPVLKTGPIVTIRTLKDTDLNKLKHFSEWKPSTGDLELF